MGLLVVHARARDEVARVAQIIPARRPRWRATTNSADASISTFSRPIDVIFCVHAGDSA